MFLTIEYKPFNEEAICFLNEKDQKGIWGAETSS